MNSPKTAAQLLAAAPVKFMPLGDFYAEEFKCGYVTGLVYTLRDSPEVSPEGDRWCDRLAKCMERWLVEGKIMLSGAHIHDGIARISGTGIIE